MVIFVYVYKNIVDVYNSYLPVIGVHEMHGRMHPNYWQITILLVVDLCSSLAYFMMTQPLLIAGKLPIKTLVAKQLPTNTCTCTCICIHVCMCKYMCTMIQCGIAQLVQSIGYVYALRPEYIILYRGCMI